MQISESEMVMNGDFCQCETRAFMCNGYIKIWKQNGRLCLDGYVAVCRAREYVFHFTNSVIVSLLSAQLLKIVSTDSSGASLISNLIATLRFCYYYWKLSLLFWYFGWTCYQMKQCHAYCFVDSYYIWQRERV